MIGGCQHGLAEVEGIRDAKHESWSSPTALRRTSALPPTPPQAAFGQARFSVLPEVLTAGEVEPELAGRQAEANIEHEDLGGYEDAHDVGQEMIG